MELLFSSILSVFSATAIYLIQDHIKEKHRKQDIINTLESNQNEEMNIIKEGIKALLHDRIIQKCEYHIRNDLITSDDLEELEYLNVPYKALGGNGTVEIMLREVHKLPKK